MHPNDDSIGDFDSLTVPRDFKGLWIPREIYLRKDINSLEKMLWAEINSLDNRELGGCYASENYLCGFLGIKRRQFYEMLKHLKELGLLIDVKFDGRVKIRKAVYSQDVIKDQGQQQCGKPHTSGAESRTATDIYKNKAYNKDIYSSSASALAKEKKIVSKPKQSSKEPESLKKVFISPGLTKEHISKGLGQVVMELDQWDVLCKEFGQATTVQVATELSEELAIGIRKYKDHYLTMRKWIRFQAKNKPKEKPDFRHFEGNYTMVREIPTDRY